MRAKPDHEDESLAVDMERLCPHHLQEGPATRPQQCGQQKGPSSQLLQGGPALGTPTSAGPCPSRIVGIQRLREVGDKGATILEQCGTLGQIVLIPGSHVGLACVALPCSRVSMDKKHLASHLSTCFQRTQPAGGFSRSQVLGGPSGSVLFLVVITITKPIRTQMSGWKTSR